ncbi:MAG: hypothetical protein SF339_17930 [Blastocatellia bacterium]|nr:hypothetical protein [Blastocatellia bacterium]
MIRKGMFYPAIFLAIAAAFSAQAPAQTKAISLAKTSGMTPRNVTMEQATHKGRKALRVTDAAPANAGDGDRLLILTEVDFQDGVIEVDLAGGVMPNAGEGARGFVGLAFRVAPDAAKFECFYLRPTNGRAEDQVRRNHSTQYISYPAFPWQRLRREFPEKYESYVDLAPEEWTKVKIEVRGGKAKLYVHGAAQPALLVNDLKLGTTRGAIALWVGPGTVAHFANLRVSP